MHHDENVERRSELFEAINQEDAELVRSLLADGVPPETPNESGLTPLMITAQNGGLEVLGLLLEHGAALDSRDSEGMTALMHAAYEMENQAMRLLIDAGADVNVTDESGSTALMHALENEDCDIDPLLSAGARLDVHDLAGHSLLHCAVGRHALTLIEAGAPTDTRNDEGVTTLMSALDCWDELQEQVVTALLDRGADLSALDNYDRDIVYYADNGCAFDMLPEGFRTAYIQRQEAQAAVERRKAVVRFLLTLAVIMAIGVVFTYFNNP